MILFLASNIGGVKKENDKKYPIKFFEDNEFLKNLKKNLTNNKKFVLVSSNPLDYEKNDIFLKMDIEALNLSGISFDEYIVLDDRNKSNIEMVLKDANLIFLCGGNTYIQNKFFNDINLKKYIKNINSIIVGISAGSINCAKNVYNSPESEEDLKKSPYLNGLDLTSFNIEPHFNIEDLNKKDKKIKYDSILRESNNRLIYGICDRSYIIKTKDNCILYGECYKINNGKIEKICDNEKYIFIYEEI